MNTAKLFIDGDGYILTTDNGNFSIQNDGVRHTTRTGAELTESQFDIGVQTVLDNAVMAAENLVCGDALTALSVLIQEKIEDLD